MEILYNNNKKDIILNIENLIIHKDLALFTNGLKESSHSFFKKIKFILKSMPIIRKNRSIPNFVISIEEESSIDIYKERCNVNIIKDELFSTINCSNISIYKNFIILDFDLTEYMNYSNAKIDLMMSELDIGFNEDSDGYYISLELEDDVTIHIY